MLLLPICGLHRIGRAGSGSTSRRPQPRAALVGLTGRHGSNRLISVLPDRSVWACVPRRQASFRACRRCALPTVSALPEGSFESTDLWECPRVTGIRSFFCALQMRSHALHVGQPSSTARCCCPSFLQHFSAHFPLPILPLLHTDVGLHRSIAWPAWHNGTASETVGRPFSRKQY